MNSTYGKMAQNSAYGKVATDNKVQSKIITDYKDIGPAAITIHALAQQRKYQNDPTLTQFDEGTFVSKYPPELTSKKTSQ